MWSPGAGPISIAGALRVGSTLTETLWRHPPGPGRAKAGASEPLTRGEAHTPAARGQAAAFAGCPRAHPAARTSGFARPRYRLMSGPRFGSGRSQGVPCLGVMARPGGSACRCAARWHCTARATSVFITKPTTLLLSLRSAGSGDAAVVTVRVPLKSFETARPALPNAFTEYHSHT